METSPGQPIPFIELSENEEDNKTLLVVNSYAVNLLQEMKEKKVSLIFYFPMEFLLINPYRLQF